MAYNRRKRKFFRRLARDLMILVSLCGVFYLLTIWLSNSKEIEESVPENSERVAIISQLKEGFDSKEWESVISCYKKLIELDPYDGTAVNNLAQFYNNRRYAAWRRLNWLQGGKRADSAEIDEAWAIEEKYTELSVEGYEACIKFPRYRGAAWAQLARIYSLRSRDDGPRQQEFRDKAMDYLQSLVDNGYCTSRGIKSTDELDHLKQEPDFKSICEKEDKIVKSDPYYTAVRQEAWASFIEASSVLN